MSDLIDRQVAIDAITEIDDGINMDIYTNEVRELLREVPSAQSERRTGRWIRTGKDGYCSVCEKDIPLFREDWDRWEYCETPYCPHCGAKMEVIS